MTSHSKGGVSKWYKTRDVVMGSWSGWNLVTFQIFVTSFIDNLFVQTFDDCLESTRLSTSSSSSSNFVFTWLFIKFAVVTSPTKRLLSVRIHVTSRCRKQFLGNWNWRDRRWLTSARHLSHKLQITDYWEEKEKTLKETKCENCLTYLINIYLKT